MEEKSWDAKLLEFLRTTGEEIRNETQRLMNEMSDPASQERVKQRLYEIGDWAKKTAEDAATMVEQAAAKVESAIAQAKERRAQGKSARVGRTRKPTSKSKPKRKGSKRKA